MSSGLARPRNSPASARAAAPPRHFGSEQRTFVDVDDFVGAGAHEADILTAMRMEPRVKRRAPPSRAMRIDQRADFGLDSGPRERRDERVAFPLEIEPRAHMLRRAAAAIPEIAADRRRAIGAGSQDREPLPIPSHTLARQCQRNYAPVGDP